MTPLLVIIFVASLVSLVVAFIWWPADRRNRKNVCYTALFFAGASSFATVGSMMLPVHRNEHVTRIVTLKYVHPPQIIEKEKIVYKIPGHEFDPEDPSRVCKGAKAITIDQLDISKKDADTATTWVLGHVPGSFVKITCRVDGAMDNFWKVGDTLQMNIGDAK